MSNVAEKLRTFARGGRGNAETLRAWPRDDNPETGVEQMAYTLRACARKVERLERELARLRDERALLERRMAALRERIAEGPPSVNSIIEALEARVADLERQDAPQLEAVQQTRGELASWQDVAERERRPDLAEQLEHLAARVMRVGRERAGVRNW